MNAQQLDLFNTPEYAYLNTNVEKYKTSADAVRRGVFARLDSMKKEMNPRIEMLEMQMAELRSILDKNFSEKESNIIELKTAAM